MQTTKGTADLDQAGKTDHRSQLHTALAEVDALMSKEVYDALFDTAAALGPRHVLEIGTAHGAGTIALALGAISGGHDTRITTVDTLQALPDIPSSRARFGGPVENEAIVRENFRRAGIADRVTLHVGRSDSLATVAPEEFAVDMLVLDADGRIDRDLALFGPRLAAEAMVIVDDIDGKVAAAMHGGQLSIDLKHVICAKLTGRLVEEGYLRFERRVVDTSFFRAQDPTGWDYDRLQEIALECYRELVFLEAPASSVMTSSLASLFQSTALLRPFYGSARAVYRRMSGRRSG